MILRPAPDALGTAAAVREGRASAESVVEAALARVAELDPVLQAWVCVDAEQALRQARAWDRRPAGESAVAPLAGVPLAVKDIFDTCDLPTAYGSPIHAGHRSAGDAAVVAAARACGAVVLGKTVTTEFAYFSPGPTRNPWDTARTPGGSSSGSAVAVASGMVPLALGSQTAGSLIRPASYCGVFALKPTHGRFSLEGVKPFAPSLDTLGWLARHAHDLELMRCALSGDAYQPLPVPGPRELRLAACRTSEWPAMQPGGAQAWDDGLHRLRQHGFSLPELVPPPQLAGLVEAQKLIMAHEAARSLAPEWQQHQDLISPPLRELILRGQRVSTAERQQAQAQAQRGRSEALHRLQTLDALIVPAAPGEAPLGLAATGDPVFSRVWTLLGLPCVNVPGLRGPQGLPVGLQLVGRPHEERRLLAVAQALHRCLDA